MKKVYLILALGFFALNSFAQKLPDVQEVNMQAPTGIKIDGKATEWNDTFAAENKRTDLFYNIANDNKNLYVIIKSASPAVINKIMLGGITFTVNAQGKKREKDASSLTYPLINRANRQQRTGGQGQARQQGGGQGGFQNRTQMSTQQRDSVALVQRKAQLATIKEIKVSGFKAITDSLISIYNEYGVKAVASFDQKGAFVYELAIPLSILELSIPSTKEFVYQIKLNGLSNMNFGGGGGGNFGGGNRGGNGGGGNFGGGGGQDLMSPTDFWAKYSFQKK
jgi:hypothetical protein